MVGCRVLWSRGRMNRVGNWKAGSRSKLPIDVPPHPAAHTITHETHQALWETAALPACSIHPHPTWTTGQPRQFNKFPFLGCDSIASAISICRPQHSCHARHTVPERAMSILGVSVGQAICHRKGVFGRPSWQLSGKSARRPLPFSLGRDALLINEAQAERSRQQR